jgi:hypothetical protein
MAKTRVSPHDLTDEEVLKEFVNRFQCDGAVLLYLDSQVEAGFGRWRTQDGRQWVNNLFRSINVAIPGNPLADQQKKGVTIPISQST